MTSTTTLTAARGTLLSIALRLTSFLLNQITVRFVSAAALGRASIPLELLLSTTLFVGREGFRLALTKEVGKDTGGNRSNGDEWNKNGDGNDNSHNIGHKTTEENKNDDELAKATEERRQRDQRQKVVNVSWLSVPTGAILSVLALLMHLRKCNNITLGSSDLDDAQNNEYALLDYKLAGILYCLASFVESLSEPLVIRCLQRMDVATKAKAEGAALVTKSVSCFGCLYLSRCSWFVNCIMTVTIIGGYSEKGGAPGSKANKNFAVTAFGMSQMVYAVVFSTIMYRKGSIGGIYWPKKITGSSSTQNPYRERNTKTNHAKIKEVVTSSTPSLIAQNLDLHALYLVFIFTLQGLFKHTLTEADKIVLSALADSYDQGVYALASSYGGLAARLLLQPMEENARLLFARQGASVLAAAQRGQQRCNGGDSISNVTKEHNERGKEIKSKTVLNLLIDLEETYFFLLRVVVCIGLLFAAIASNYTGVLLRVLAGSRWGSNAEASAALSAFCVYTAFLALNGITEAFVYGVARSGNDVGKIGVVHALVGGIFAVIAPGLVRAHGAAGLVTANSLAMGLRSTYSLYYSYRYFARGRCAEARLINAIMGTLVRITPHIMVLGAFGASFVITRSSRNYFYDAQISSGGSWIVASVQHVAIGVSCAVLTASLSLWLETDIRYAMLQLIKRKSD